MKRLAEVLRRKLSSMIIFHDPTLEPLVDAALGNDADREIESMLLKVRNETIEECALVAECAQLPQGKIIPVPKSFKMSDTKVCVIDDLTKYAIAMMVRALKESKS